MILAAQIVIALIGAMVAVLCGWGVASPVRLLHTARTVMGSRWGMPLAVGVRVVLGLSLLVAAPASKFVIAFEVLGWVALAAAAALPAIGRRRVMAMIDWLQRGARHALRLWLLLGVPFGLFLIYGVVGGSP